MAITVTINSTDRSGLIEWDSLTVTQNLTNQVDTASFSIKKYGARTFVPAVNDDVIVYDDSTKVFAGKITSVKDELLNNAEGMVYHVDCVDHTFEFDAQLVAKAYEGQTVAAIVADIVSNFTSGGFSAAGVTPTIVIDKIVFNQIPPSQCLKRIADLFQYHWYIDPDKVIQMFPKFTVSAPFDLTDSSANFIKNTLRITNSVDQVANKVVVRGGEYDGNEETGIITVNGNDTSQFNLPERYADLEVELDTGSGFVTQTVGAKFLNDFTSYDVLYNFNSQSIEFATALSDGDRIRYTGKPKVRVLAVGEDPLSIATYGVREKIVRDNSIEDLDTARRRAYGEIYAYKDAVSDASFKTYNSGLNVGQTINITSTRHNVTEDYIISRVQFSTRTKTSFSYQVQLVTTKTYTFIELLQKLLMPDDTKFDETEIAEIIKAITEDLIFSETITNVEPELIEETLDTEEEISRDPLGTDTEPTYVLAPYFPTDFTDTKRVGLLNRSLIVY